MKVLMFGWEFPPNNLGGLGTACLGLTKSLSSKGTAITFVLPKGSPKHDHLDMISTDGLTLSSGILRKRYVNSLLVPYQSSSEYNMARAYHNLMSGGKMAGELYGSSLFEEVDRYAEKAKIIAQFEDFDVIHCHDWMTFKAGIKAKEVSGKPLVVHVHSTDFDRTGGHPNQYVYDLEREGMHKADKVIAVSNFTKDMITNHYGIPFAKIEVVHNAVDHNIKKKNSHKKDENVVLFLGRLTLQKGPDYFIEAAKKVLRMKPNTKFVVAGSGDMYRRMVDRAAELGLGRHVLFTGHLTGEDINKAYQMADLYVMPSVSEPFGITPLESLKNDTPVLISKQSGVSEVLNNALKVNFWDIDEMTNKIVSVLSYSALKNSLTEEGQKDIQRLSWDDSADKCIAVYKGLTNR
jgi:glycosyltransferase involved in cell wall biosynthesis